MNLLNEYQERIKTLLPAGWEIKATSSEIILTGNDECYQLHENKINAPVSRENDDEKKKRFMAFGSRIRPLIVYSYSPVRTGREFIKLIEANRALDTQLTALQETLNAQKIKRSFKGDYLPADEREAKIIEDFESKKKELLARKKPYPDYIAGSYEVRKLSAAGTESEFISIYPPAVAEETAKVIADIDAALPKFVATYLELKDRKDKPVALPGTVSSIMYQHVIANPQGYPRTVQIDFDQSQTIGYGAFEMPKSGQHMFIGKAIEVEWKSGKLAKGESFSEHHIIIDKITD